VSDKLARRRGGVLEATVFAIVGIAILIGFGLWQLDRKAWKENLIATLPRLAARRKLPHAQLAAVLPEAMNTA
jgi:cytochrome oxidase assembly protein ShyY1